MNCFSARSSLVVIVSFLFVRAALSKETEVSCPLRKPAEVGKRSENSPEAVNKEYQFIVLVETKFFNRSHTWGQECVGTLVTETQVVTAGHCVQPELKNNAQILEVNVFFLRCANMEKFHCMKTPVIAFINYNQLSRDGEPQMDLGLLYLLHAFKPLGARTLPLCNKSESKQASSGPLFLLSFKTDEQKTGNLLLTRVPLTVVKNVKQNRKWLFLQLQENGIACNGDSGSPVVLQTGANHLCLLAVQAIIRDFWDDNGIPKSHWIEAPIVKFNRIIAKLIKEERKPNSVEIEKWYSRDGLIFREFSQSLAEERQETELYIHSNKAGCFNALWQFCKPGK